MPAQITVTCAFFSRLLLCGLLASPTIAWSDVAVKPPLLPAPTVSYAIPQSAQFLSQSTHIAVQDTQTEFFVVQASINGQGPYRFLIDTGSDFTMLSTAVAQSLQLPLEKHAHFAINNTAQVADYYIIKDLSLGAAHLYNYEAKALPEPSLITHLNEEKHLAIDGIIGFGAFYHYLLTFDFAHQTILLQSGELSLADKNTFPLAPNRRAPTLSVLLKDKNKHSLTFFCILDSGFMGYISMPPDITSVPFDLIERKQTTVRGVLGQFNVVKDQVDAIAYAGNVQVKDPILMYAKEVYGKKGASYGLMGLYILDKLIVTFDQKKNLVKIEK